MVLKQINERLYDITFNDNPEILITYVQLKGENYDEGKKSMRTSVSVRNKFGFNNETIRRPDETYMYLEDWLAIN